MLICDVYKMSEENGRGGAARIAGALKAEKARSPHVLIAHAGDAFSPSLMSGLDQGAHMVELLNLMPIDAFVPGNHEFDFGKEVFLKRISEAKFPLFAANLRDVQGKAIDRFMDNRSFFVQFGGVKIGLAGLAKGGGVRVFVGEAAASPMSYCPATITTSTSTTMVGRRSSSWARMG